MKDGIYPQDFGNTEGRQLIKSVLVRGHHLGYKFKHKADSKCQNYNYLHSFKSAVYLNTITVFNCTLCCCSVMAPTWTVFGKSGKMQIYLKTSKRIY